MPRAGNADTRGPGEAVLEEDAVSSGRVWL